MKEFHHFLECFPMLFLLLVPSIILAQSINRNDISDSAFNDIIASYYHSSPFHQKINPQELLKEFANKKVIRKRKLRPKKVEEEIDHQRASIPVPTNLPFKKVKKRMHLRQRQTTIPPTTTSLPVKTIRLRNRPTYTLNPESLNNFSERSYDYEIDYYDRNALGNPFVDIEDQNPVFRSDTGFENRLSPDEEEKLYAELENFFPTQMSSERDPASINYDDQHREKNIEESKEINLRKPIYTPEYGHPYAEPLSYPNPMDTGIYDTDYVNTQNGHFDIPKINQDSEHPHKTTVFAPTIPPTTTLPTSTTTSTTTTTTTTTAVPSKTQAPTTQPSYVKSLQRRFPRVNDYDYQKLPQEEFEVEKDVSHLKAEHRGLSTSPLRKHPGYRDLPPQRRQNPPRRRFQNNYKEPHFGGNFRKQHPQFVELTKEREFFAPSTAFGQNIFESSQFKSPEPDVAPEYKALSQRYPTFKPKKAPITRNRYHNYESPTPNYRTSSSLKPSRAPSRTPSTYAPPVSYHPRKQTPSYTPNHSTQEKKLKINSKFQKFRDNSEFSGYLDHSAQRGAFYDIERGFPILPPPPAMIATTQNFFGFTDVPKLGSKVNYNPPELIYNQIFEDKIFANGRKMDVEDDDTDSMQYLNEETHSESHPSKKHQNRESFDASHHYFNKPFRGNDAFARLYN